jgi:hypothetical protein
MWTGLCIIVILCALLCTSFINAAPTLTGFRYEDSYGYFVMTFSELVSARTLDLTKLVLLADQLSNGATWTNNNFTIKQTYNNMALQGNTTKPFFLLGSNDYSRLKQTFPTFGTRINRTIIHIETGFFNDWYHVQSIANTGFQATEYLPDTLPPYLINWSLNMMLGHLTITFSEPIKGLGSSGLQFALSGAAIQSARNLENIANTPRYVRLIDNDEQSLISTNHYNTEITIALGRTNTNRIKQGSVTGRTASTSWLSIISPIVNDTSGNPLALASVDHYSAVEITKFTRDENKPLLMKWTYDVYPGIIALYFNEVIEADSFNFSSIALTSHSGPHNSRVIVRLNADVIREKQTIDSDIYKIRLAQTLYDDITAMPTMLNFNSNSYLVVDDGVAWDTSPQQNKFYDNSTTLTNARNIHTLIPDTVRPEIRSAVLNMTSKQLIIGFQKNVRTSSILLSALTIQNTISGGDETKIFSNSDATVVIPIRDSRYSTIQLESSGFNYLKAATSLGKSIGSSFIAFTISLLEDKAFVPNKVVNIPTSEGFQITTYVADFVKPYLVSWYADMHEDRIILIFSEPVNTKTINVADIKIYSDSDISLPSTWKVQLSTATVYEVNVEQVTLQLSRDEATSIKSKAPLCTTRTFCYISHTSQLVQDTDSFNSNGKAVNNDIMGTTILQSSASFRIDQKGPKLLKYTLDMDKALVNLEFTEPVESAFLNPTGITFFTNNYPPLSVHEVNISSKSYVSTADGVFVTLGLSIYDFVALKLVGIAQNGTLLGNDVYVDLRPITIKDVAGNPLNGSSIPYDRIIRQGIVTDITKPSSIIKDASPANIIAIYRHTTSQDLSIYFDDVIDIATVSLGYFYAYNPLSATKHSLLDSSLITLNNSDVIRINMTKSWADMKLKDIGQTQGGMYIYVSTSSAFLDIPRNNKNSIIATSEAVGEGQKLIYFRLDLSNKKLIIPLAFTIDWGAWDASKISIYSKTNFLSMTLTSKETIGFIDNNNTIIINIHKDTLSALTTLMPVSDKNDITLNVGIDAFVDGKGKHLTSELILDCKQILIDTTPPAIESFSLDLNSGDLDIFFTKPISTSSISTSALSMVNATNGIIKKISLSNAKVSFAASVQTSIKLTLNDGSYPTLRDQIHETMNMGTSFATTRLQIDKGFISDTSKPAQFMVPVSDLNSTQATIIISDTTPPSVVSWGIDMSHRYINVTFDEAVRHKSNFASYYLLLRDHSDSTSAQRYLLTSSTVAGSGNTIKMLISEEDINAVNIQNKQLCTSSENCFLSIRSSSIQDISTGRNPCAGILYKYAAPVSKYVTDVIPPKLVAFNFSLATAELWMHFDEIIDCDLVDLRSLRWQYLSFLGTSPLYFMLSTSSPDCSLYSGKYTTDIYVLLDNLDWIGLKAVAQLMKTRSTAFVADGVASITDTFNNKLKSIPDGYAIQVTTFTADTTRPEIISYTINVAKQLVLYFNEPMKASGIKNYEIQFQSSLPPYINSYKLTGATFNSADTYKMIVNIALNGDYARISGDSAVFSSQASTFMSIPDTAISDTSGNLLLGIPDSLAKALGPSIIAWDLDLDYALLTIEVNEVVSGGFIVAGVEIQNEKTRTVNTKSYALTTTTIVSMVGSAGLVFSVTLDDLDINSLKYEGLVNSRDSCFIVVPFGLAQSVVQATLIPFLRTVEISNVISLKLRDLGKDKTKPNILSFGINFNTGKLYIRFDEPIQINSFNPSAVTVISTSTSAQAALTGAKSITLENLSIVVIEMTESDFNNVKVAQASGVLNTMIFSYQGATDYFGNQYPGNNELSPIIESGSVADTTAPSIVSAALDIQEGTLILYFDEVIDSTGVATSYITLMSQADPNDVSTQKFSLTKYTVIELLNDGGVKFDSKTYKKDLSDFVIGGGIGTSVSNTFIRYESISDVFGNVMPAAAVRQADSVKVDFSELELIGFRIRDMTTSYSMELSFNKPVLLSTFRCSDFDLLLSDGTVSVDLGDSDCTLTTTGTLGSDILTVDIARSTLNNDISPLGWIKASATSVTKDFFANVLTESIAIPIGPSVKDWFINMNTGLITFGFSTFIPITGNAFDSTKLGFYSTATNKEMKLASSPASFSSLFVDSPPFSFLATFTLSSADLLVLKELDVTKDNAYLILDINSISCDIGLPMVPLILNDKKLPSKFYVDSVRPVIISTLMDLGNDLLTIVFDEPVRAAALVITQIRIQSLGNSLTNSMTLTNTQTSPTSIGNTLTIIMHKNDVQTIVLRENLAQNLTSSYLSFASKTIADYAGNALPAISSINARIFDTYVADSVPPQLLTFDLNMNTELLTLRFSEPVRSSMLLTSITMMSRASSFTGTYHALTGGTVLDNDQSNIRIQLSPSDVFAMKNTTGLVRNAASSFLITTSSLTYDKNGNALVSIDDIRGKPVSNFIEDTTSPIINSIDFNVNTEIITFHTNEVAWIQYTDPQGCTIQDFNENINVNKKYTLTKTATKVYNPLNLEFTNALSLKLGSFDIDTIKYRQPLLSDITKTFFAINNILLKDVYENSVAAIPSTNALRVGILVKDITPPTLLKFQIDMSNGVIDLSWSESIKYSSIKASQIILQTHERRAFGSYRILDDSIITSDVDINSRFINIKLSDDTMAYMKQNGICKTIFTCYLSWTDTFLSDQFDNFALPVWDASVDGFHPILTTKVYDAANIHTGYFYDDDRLSPILNQWRVDRLAYKIYFTFNEPITAVNLNNMYIYSSNLLEDKQIIGNIGKEIIKYDNFGRTMIIDIYHDVPCDESKSVITNCIYKHFKTVLDSSLSGSFYFNFFEGAVQDLANTPNLNNAIASRSNALIKENTPSCSNCENGKYIKTACTHINDAICASCSTCSAGKFTQELCSSTSDVRCKQCSSCRIGKYISQTCTNSTDTHCSPCTECEPTQYMSSKCANGQNTVCNSCQVCNLPSKYAEQICNAKGKYEWWYKQNCCFDKDGLQVPCRNLDLNNIKIAKRSGRHHWVFPDPDVDSSLYGFGLPY